MRTPRGPMNPDQALRTTHEFLDEYSTRHDGFSPSGDPDDYLLEYQESYQSDDGALVAVFGVRPEVDPDNPPEAILALGKRCLDALLEAHPELESLTLAMEFLN